MKGSMMNGIVLDRKSGRPSDPRDILDHSGRSMALVENEKKGWMISDQPRDDDAIAHQLAMIDEAIATGWHGRQQQRAMDADVSRLPLEIRALMEKGAQEGPFGHRNSGVTWRETLTAIVADGTAVTAAAETIMVPDFTLPAGYLTYGRTVKYTLFGRVSTVITTPGTITQRLRYGGVAGVVLAASGAYAPDPTAASTNLTFWTEYYLTTRSVGATGTVMCVGRTFLNDVDDATVATIVANLAMTVIPVSAPATATINTTTANALSPTWTQSAATGSMTVHVALVEALN